jgi:phage N-6-adenine-methyltransferase
MTQEELAGNAGLSIPTVRLLERTHGNLTSWNVVLGALALEVAGRNLPAGETLGRSIAALRRSRGFTQRGLAELVGVTQPTILALERYDRGRLEILDRVLVRLGAGAYLIGRGEKKSFFTHAGNASTHHGWETPPEILETLYEVFGKFDLDPCAARKSRTRVRARVHFTEEDDGLSLPWHGVVFVNPPYGRTLGLWVAKAHHEVQEGRARTVVALLPARPDTAYWHKHVAGRATVYFLRGRLRFSDGEQSAPFPSALVVWGAAPETIPALDRALPDAWRTS